MYKAYNKYRQEQKRLGGSDVSHTKQCDVTNKHKISANNKADTAKRQSIKVMSNSGVNSDKIGLPETDMAFSSSNQAITGGSKPPTESEQELLTRLLSGDLSVSVAAESRLVRVFTSSTFTGKSRSQHLHR